MNINLGSAETIIVDVIDALDQLAALPAGTTYLIRKADDGADVEIDLVPTIDGLRAICLVDTTTGYEADDYDLFLKVPTGVETPLLGPHRFRVV